MKKKTQQQDNIWDTPTDTVTETFTEKAEEVIEKTRARYVEAYERLTGEKFI